MSIKDARERRICQGSQRIWIFGNHSHPAWFWVAPVGQRKRKDILSHLPPLR
jgi:hypothetical protein